VKVKATRSFITSEEERHVVLDDVVIKASEFAFLAFLMRVTFLDFLIQLDEVSEVRKLFHSSLSNFFHPPVSSSFLHPNIRISRPFYSFNPLKTNV